MSLFNSNSQIPSKGYILPSGYGYNYRATAVVYMERENKQTVEHVNGNLYTLAQLKNVMNLR